MFSNDLLDNITPEEYAKKNIELHAKYSDNLELNAEEVDFFCSCTKFGNLLDFPICLDEYFKRVFLASRSDYPRDLIAITDKDRVYYKGFVKEWDLTINKKDHSNELLQIAAKETRQELKNFRKNYSFQDNYSWDKYIQGKNTIIEWSKYRYIFIKKIFDIKIKASEFDLILNNQKIVFNYFSLTHILTRHFAHIIKPYSTDKTHFTEDIGHAEIHTKLKCFFEEIDKSKIYLNDSVEEINFKFKKHIYKVYCAYATKHIKGKQVNFLRLNSFFPVDNAKMLERLKNEFTERKVTDDLSVFIKR